MITWKSAIVSGGKAKMIRNAVTSIIQVKTGTRIMVMPGARMLTIVTIRFIAVTSVPMPPTNRPIM